MGGTLIPEHYVPHKSTQTDVELASIIWGLSLGVTLYTLFTAGKQTFKAYRRARKVTAYMVFVWLEWMSSTTMGVISWFFLKETIEPSLEYFLAILFLWCIQVHTLMQIIINRISILTVDGMGTRRIKWGTFGLLLLINISVACIWVPASLQINDKFISINNVWDRIQKALICVIDALLNVYFVYLVNSRLITNGLTKYTRLFRFNLVMIVVSVALDIMIVAMMSLPNKLVYVQFHPLAYLLKLQIEMGMADLIVKIVRATNPQVGSSEPYPKYGGTTAPVGTLGRNANNSTKIPTWHDRHHQTQTQVEVGDEADGLEMEMYGKSIKKTVVTEVVTVDKNQPQQGQFQARQSRTDTDGDDDMASSSSSTRELKEHGGRGSMA